MGFKPLTEGDMAIIVTNGVHQQCPLYEFAGGLFAKMGNGFVRLKANGSTSKSGSRLDHLETDAPLWQDKFGRIATADRPGFRAITLGMDEEKETLQIEVAKP